MCVPRRLQELERTRRKYIYLLFVDLHTAYDFVDRALLWKVLAQLGVRDNYHRHSSVQRWHTSMCGLWCTLELV